RTRWYAGAARQVLPRPRAAPGGDDRLLRAAVARPARLPGARDLHRRRSRRRLQLPRPRTAAHLPVALVQPVDRGRRRHPPERGHARHRRRAAPRLVVAVALLGARVGLQHRLRPPEPVVRARQGARLRAARRLAGRAVHRARGGHVRLPRADTLRRRSARQLAGRLHALAARLGGRGSDLPARRVLAADERAAAPRGRAAGRAARDRSARADLPGAADLPAPDEGRDHAAGLRRAAAAAHLALPDGQLDHPRRRGQLVAAVRAPAGGAGAGAGLAGGVERGRGAGAVRVARLPAVPELGDRALLAVGDEDRVVAEALGAAWLGDDAPLQRARAAQLAAVCVQGHELADVAGATGVALHARERLEQPLDRVAGGEAGGVHARAAIEARDLDARVLSDRPAVGGREPAPEDRL